MVGIVGTSIPIGTYDSSRLIDLGTKRWSFRLGVGTVTPLSKAWAQESTDSVFLFTKNKDVFGHAVVRSICRKAEWTCIYRTGCQRETSLERRIRRSWVSSGIFSARLVATMTRSAGSRVMHFRAFVGATGRSHL